MSGNSAGGKKAALTIKERYGEDYFVENGKKGGQTTGVKKGFAANPELASKAGAKGGRISRRGKNGSRATE